MVLSEGQIRSRKFYFFSGYTNKRFHVSLCIRGTGFTAEFSESPYSRFNSAWMTEGTTLIQYPVGESGKVRHYAVGWELGPEHSQAA